MELGTCLIINQRFNSVAHSFLEARVLKEDEALWQDWLAGTCADIVFWHVANKQEAEDFLEDFNILIIQVRNEFSKLLPGYALATDIDVWKKLIELLFSKLSTLGSWSACRFIWWTGNCCHHWWLSENAISEVLDGKREKLAECLAGQDNFHVERAETVRACVRGGSAKQVEMKDATND